MRTEPLINFSYTEGADGVMYPNIAMNKAQIGKFGQAWKTYMKLNHPQRLSELNMMGMLHSTMKEIDEEADNYKEKVIQSLLKKRPLPQTENILERAAHMGMLARIAQELAMSEIVFQTR